MLLRKFKETGPDIVVLIFILAVLVWIRPIINPELPSSMGYDVRPMPLFRLLAGIAGAVPIISVLLTFLIVLLSGFLLVNFNTSEFFISERTFLPALIFVLFSGILPQNQVLNPALPAAVFLILAIRKILDSYRVQYTAYSFFDAGLLLSTGSLFYASFIWFGILLLIGTILLRTGNIREIMISVLGLATPWFLMFGLYYVTGYDMAAIISDLNYNLFARSKNLSLTGLNIVLLAVTGFIILVSQLYLFSVINMKKIKSRKTFRLLNWAFLITLIIYFMLPPVSAEAFWLAWIPASYLLSHYFVFVRKKLIPELLFLILFIVVAVAQISG